MKKPASFKAFTYLTLFGFATTIPLLVLVGALLFQSTSVQHEQLEARVLQVLDALATGIDRDLDRDITFGLRFLFRQHSAAPDGPTITIRRTARKMDNGCSSLSDSPASRDACGVTVRRKRAGPTLKTSMFPNGRVAREAI